MEKTASSQEDYGSCVQKAEVPEKKLKNTPFGYQELILTFSNIVTALRNPPTSPMPNLVQNLLGMNPLQFMMTNTAAQQQQPVPTSTANLTAAQATSQMLQQAGEF